MPYLAIAATYFQTLSWNIVQLHIKMMNRVLTFRTFSFENKANNWRITLNYTWLCRHNFDWKTYVWPTDSVWVWCSGAFFPGYRFGTDISKYNHSRFAVHFCCLFFTSQEHISCTRYMGYPYVLKRLDSFLKGILPIITTSMSVA